MLVVLPVFAGLLLVAGLYLLRIEARRYWGDRTSAPPLAPEDAAKDRWSALTADLIAGLSILAALTAWQAAGTFGLASDKTGLALRQTAQYQTRLARVEATIQFDDRLTQLYQQHVMAQQNLYSQADAARAMNPVFADRLEAEARVEGAQARVLARDFLGFYPSVGPDGRASFDVASQEQLAKASDADLRTLDQAHIRLLDQQADSIRLSAQNLVLASAMVIAAAFFFTLARLGWKHRRLYAMVPGSAVLATAIFVLVTVATSLGSSS
jgi:hypothetical protein